MQGEYIFDDCCYYICTSFGSFTHVELLAVTLLLLRVQEFNSTHSRMRSLIAKHIVQRLSSKRVRQIEIRVPDAIFLGGGGGGGGGGQFSRELAR